MKATSIEPKRLVFSSMGGDPRTAELVGMQKWHGGRVSILEPLAGILELKRRKRVVGLCHPQHFHRFPLDAGLCVRKAS